MLIRVNTCCATKGVKKLQLWIGATDTAARIKKE